MDNFKIKTCKELRDLHEFCKNINKQTEFERIYIATKEIEKMENKKAEKAKLKNKIILYTSMALLGTLSGIA